MWPPFSLIATLVVSMPIATAVGPSTLSPRPPPAGLYSLSSRPEITNEMEAMVPVDLSQPRLDAAASLLALQNKDPLYASPKLTARALPPLITVAPPSSPPGEEEAQEPVVVSHVEREDDPMMFGVSNEGHRMSFSPFDRPSSLAWAPEELASVKIPPPPEPKAEPLPPPLLPTEPAKRGGKTKRVSGMMKRRRSQFDTLAQSPALTPVLEASKAASQHVKIAPRPLEPPPHEKAPSMAMRDVSDPQHTVVSSSVKKKKQSDSVMQGSLPRMGSFDPPKGSYCVIDKDHHAHYITPSSMTRRAAEMAYSMQQDYSRSTRKRALISFADYPGMEGEAVLSPPNTASSTRSHASAGPSLRDRSFGMYRISDARITPPSSVSPPPKQEVAPPQNQEVVLPQMEKTAVVPTKPIDHPAKRSKVEESEASTSEQGSCSFDPRDRGIFSGVTMDALVGDTFDFDDVFGDVEMTDSIHSADTEATLADIYPSEKPSNQWERRGDERRRSMHAPRAPDGSELPEESGKRFSSSRHYRSHKQAAEAAILRAGLAHKTAKREMKLPIRTDTNPLYRVAQPGGSRVRVVSAFGNKLTKSTSN